MNDLKIMLWAKDHIERHQSTERARWQLPPAVYTPNVAAIKRNYRLISERRGIPIHAIAKDFVTYMLNEAGQEGDEVDVRSLLHIAAWTELEDEDLRRLPVVGAVA